MARSTVISFCFHPTIITCLWVIKTQLKPVQSSWWGTKAMKLSGSLIKSLPQNNWKEDKQYAGRNCFKVSETAKCFLLFFTILQWRRIDFGCKTRVLFKIAWPWPFSYFSVYITPTKLWKKGVLTVKDKQTSTENSRCNGVSSRKRDPDSSRHSSPVVDTSRDNSTREMTGDESGIKADESKWRRIKGNDGRWREMKAGDGKWRQLKGNETHKSKWRQMNVHEGRWWKMKGDERKWRKMNSNGGRWREMNDKCGGMKVDSG